ncbi:MAG: cupin domain-containing protein [Promethearchaeota archaeon]
MLIRRVQDIKPEKVTMDGVKDTYIQWLIGKEKSEVENFAMRRFIIKPGGEIGLHSHDWEHEIFVLQGKGKIGIDNEEAEVEENTAIYVPPNATHWYKNTGNKDLIFLCLIPIKNE